MATLTLTDEGITLEVEDGASLLDLAEEHDMGMIFGCTAGHCAVCMMVVLEGSEHLSAINDTERYTLTQAELDANMRLACQVRVLQGAVRLTQALDG